MSVSHQRLSVIAMRRRRDISKAHRAAASLKKNGDERTLAAEIFDSWAFRPFCLSGPAFMTKTG